jgi:DNA-binding GntR family transcriptional regulator
VATQSNKLYRKEKPLRDIVGEEIRERIFNGTFPPGARLVERDLAEMFSVSRLPVREALRVLLNEGLVENLPSRGVVVRTLDRRQVSELFDIREALEVLAVRQATERIAEGARNSLEETLAEARTAFGNGDLDAAHAANSRFHDQIIALTGNELLQTLLEPLLGRLHWLFRQVSDFEQVTAEHDDLARAILSGDPDRAAASARAHVMTYRARTLAYLFGGVGDRDSRTAPHDPPQIATPAGH